MAEENFQDTFIQEVALSQESQVPRFALDQEAQLLVNFAPLLRAGRQGEEHLHYLPATRYLNNGSLLPIDAVLGAPYNLYDVIADNDVPSISASRREELARLTFHAINWTRELINAFSTQLGPKYSAIRRGVVDRIRTLIELERFLDVLVSHAPSAAAKKAAHPRTSFRALEPSALLVLTYREPQDDDARDASTVPWDPKATLLTLEPIILNFLAGEVQAKFKYLLAVATRLGNRVHVVPTWMAYYETKRDCIIELKYVFAALAVHLKRLITQFTDMPEDPSLGPPGTAESAVRLILGSFKLLYSTDLMASELHDIFKEVIGAIVGVSGTAAQRATMEVLLEHSFTHFEALRGVVEDLDAHVALVELLAAILAKLGSVEAALPLRARLSAIAGAALKRKWPNATVKPEAVDVFLRVHLREAREPIKLLEKFAIDVLPNYLNSMKKTNMDTQPSQVIEDAEDADKYHTLTPATLTAYYKVLFSMLNQTLTSFRLNAKKNQEIDPKPVLDALHQVNQVFQSLVVMTKSGHSHLVYNALKFGRAYVETFVKSVPWLSQHFKVFQTKCMQLFKPLQTGTRQLQVICAHGKVTSSMQLMKFIPPVRKAMEALIFQVKMLLQNNDALGAFWLGNLRHKNINGEEVSSQIPKIQDEEEEYEEDEEEDENSKSKSRSKGKKHKRKGKKGHERNEEEHEEEDEEHEKESSRKRKRTESDKKHADVRQHSGNRKKEEESDPMEEYEDEDEEEINREEEEHDEELEEEEEEQPRKKRKSDSERTVTKTKSSKSKVIKQSLHQKKKAKKSSLIDDEAESSDDDDEDDDDEEELDGLDLDDISEILGDDEEEEMF